MISTQKSKSDILRSLHSRGIALERAEQARTEARDSLYELIGQISQISKDSGITITEQEIVQNSGLARETVRTALGKGKRNYKICAHCRQWKCDNCHNIDTIRVSQIVGTPRNRHKPHERPADHTCSKCGNSAGRWSTVKHHGLACSVSGEANES